MWFIILASYQHLFSSCTSAEHPSWYPVWLCASSLNWWRLNGGIYTINSSPNITHFLLKGHPGQIAEAGAGVPEPPLTWHSLMAAITSVKSISVSAYLRKASLFLKTADWLVSSPSRFRWWAATMAAYPMSVDSNHLNGTSQTAGHSHSAQAGDLMHAMAASFTLVAGHDRPGVGLRVSSPVGPTLQNWALKSIFYMMRRWKQTKSNQNLFLLKKKTQVIQLPVIVNRCVYTCECKVHDLAKLCWVIFTPSC